jgi:hypothetical protein
MFATNHVLSGVVIGRALKRRPVVAFLAGVGSHLLLDAVPHWGCDRREPGGTDRFFRAAKRDGLLGIGAMAVATMAVEPPARAAVVAAMVGAVILDLDKPSEYFFALNPYPASIRRLHAWVQNESPDGLANEVAAGVGLAIADAVLIGRGRAQWHSRPNDGGAGRA